VQVDASLQTVQFAEQAEQVALTRKNSEVQLVQVVFPEQEVQLAWTAEQRRHCPELR
jgi:hypothetical protein